MSGINFGTDGWRGIIAETFTVQNLREVVQAIMSYLSREKQAPFVLIGCDTRFMSEYYARAAAEVAAGNGARVLICPSPVTTPMLSYAVHANAGDGGIMITASHNPCHFNGVKFKASYGGSATPKITWEIESLISKSPVRTMPYDKAREQGVIALSDCFLPYKKRIQELININAIKEAGLRAALDCMHGSIGCNAERLREALGLELGVIHQERDPYFGGVNPEPVEENMGALMSLVREGDFDIGFATDGDADRLGVVDGRGNYINPHQVFSLLLLHMSRNRKQSGMVVRTVSTSSLVDRIAADLGLPVKETPVGFKHICELMQTEDVLIGGEENGGVGIKGHIPERDGIISALLLMEMMAFEGKPLAGLVADMETQYGQSYYKRLDVPVDGLGSGRIFQEIKDRAGSAYEGFGVREVSAFDGVKVVLNDGSWVLFRPSGTEPLIRIYCEAADPVRLEKLVSRAKEAFLG